MLSHENTDIAIDVIEIIQELTDEDVGAEVDDLAEDEAEGSGMATKTRMAMGELIDELVSSSCLGVFGRGILTIAQQFPTRFACRESE